MFAFWWEEVSFSFSSSYGQVCEAVVLSADDWVCIFVLFVVWMRHPAQGSTGSWVIAGLIFKWFSL